jgi:hypothetical protein
MTVDELWASLHQKGHNWPSEPDFTQMVLGIHVLFALGQIEQLDNGRLRLLPDETD